MANPTRNACAENGQYIPLRMTLPVLHIIMIAAKEVNFWLLAKIPGNRCQDSG